mgnify:FL=1
MDGFILIMKKTIISIAILFSVCASAQKVDSTEMKRQQQNKQDSIIISAVMNDMKLSLYGKVQPGYYDLLQELQKEYLRQKSIQWNTKPKK